MCVVDFCCPACFFLFYSVLLLIFWFSFDCIRRSGGVFTRVYVARVSFLCTVCVSPVLLPILCVSWLFLVFIFTILGFASMGDCFYGAWTPFLQVVVSV